MIPRRTSDGSGARPGRPARISRSAIIETVLDLGFDAATTSTVAERLGVDQSTLYGHVRNRADMLDAAAEEAIRRIEMPQPDGGWRSYARSCTEAIWDIYERVPGLSRYLRTTMSTPPTMITHAATMMQTLIDLTGCSEYLAALVVDTIGDMVTDSHLMITALDAPVAGIPGTPTGRERASAIVGSGTSDATDTSGAPNATDAADRFAHIMFEAMGTPEAPSTWWRDKIDLVLDGVAHRLAEPGRSGSDPEGPGGDGRPDHPDHDRPHDRGGHGFA